MSDVYCARCKEPWDTHHLLWDEVVEVVHEQLPYEVAERLAARWRAKRPRLSSKVPAKAANGATWEQLFERRGWKFAGHSLLGVLHCSACPADAVRDRDAEHLVEDVVALAAGDEDALSVEMGETQRAYAHAAHQSSLAAAGIPVITRGVEGEHPHCIAEDHGTVWRFQLFGDAREWWDENVAEAPRLGDAHIVEHRFAVDLVRGLKDAGFRVEVR